MIDPGKQGPTSSRGDKLTISTNYQDATKQGIGSDKLRLAIEMSTKIRQQNIEMINSRILQVQQQVKQQASVQKKETVHAFVKKVEEQVQEQKEINRSIRNKMKVGQQNDNDENQNENTIKNTARLMVD